MFSWSFCTVILIWPFLWEYRNFDNYFTYVTLWQFLNANPLRPFERKLSYLVRLLVSLKRSERPNSLFSSTCDLFLLYYVNVFHDLDVETWWNKMRVCFSTQMPPLKFPCLSENNHDIVTSNLMFHVLETNTWITFTAKQIRWSL